MIILWHMSLFMILGIWLRKNIRAQRWIMHRFQMIYSKHKALELNGFLLLSDILTLCAFVVRRNKSKVLSMPVFYCKTLVWRNVCFLLMLWWNHFTTIRIALPFVIHSACLYKILHEEICTSYPKTTVSTLVLVQVVESMRIPLLL